MARMLDMIRNSQVPSNLMQSASRGALSVPPAETIEILVHLAIHHKLFSERARLTLAGWDEAASIAAAADPQTSAEVLGYFISPENVRTCLLPALAENTAISDEALNRLAVTGSRLTVEALLPSPRIMNSPLLMQALQVNPNLRPNELGEISKKLEALGAAPVAASEPSDAALDEVVEIAVVKYFEENAAELAAEKDKPFQAIAATSDESAEAASLSATPVSATPAVTTAVTPAVTPVATPMKKTAAAVPDRRDSVLQKISRLDIRGRITLAMRGTKEDRSILIRDATKLVAVAVLDSPKVSDGEVEKFALQKNVLEAVLRAIPLRRKYAKNYSIMRNLVSNPRTPIDLSLGLMKNLMIHDLKNLSGNKEVSDTIRKLALRMYKQKVEKKD